MGWANCGTDSEGRPIGYAHGAQCDHPGCKARIHRGLAYACGDMHGDGNRHNGDYGCEKYFCSEHLLSRVVSADGDSVQLCPACAAEVDRDHPGWDDL